MWPWDLLISVSQATQFRQHLRLQHQWECIRQHLHNKPHPQASQTGKAQQGYLAVRAVTVVRPPLSLVVVVLLLVLQFADNRQAKRVRRLQYYLHLHLLRVSHLLLRQQYRMSSSSRHHPPLPLQQCILPLPFLLLPRTRRSLHLLLPPTLQSPPPSQTAVCTTPIASLGSICTITMKISTLVIPPHLHSVKAHQHHSLVDDLPFLLLLLLLLPPPPLPLHPPPPRMSLLLQKSHKRLSWPHSSVLLSVRCNGSNQD